MYQFPIRYYTDNLIISQTGCWACFEIIGYDYDNRDADEKIKILNNLINFLSDTSTELKGHLIPIKQDSEKILKECYEEVDEDDPLKEFCEAYTNGTINYLKDKQKVKMFYNPTTEEEFKYTEDEINDYKTFIEVKLEDIKPKDFINTIQDTIEYILKEPKMALEKLLGVGDNKILESKITAFKKASRAYFSNQSQRIKLRKASEKDIQWLYRRVDKRGLKSDIPITDFAPLAQYKQVGKDIEIDPLIDDIRCLFSGKIYQKDRYLEIKTDSGTSYQTFLALTEKPKYNFPGYEYIFRIQNINIPIETCIHMRALDETESKRVVEVERKKITSEYNNADEGGISVDKNTKEAAREVNSMDEEVRINKRLTKTSITFCLADDDLESLEKNVQMVTTYFKDRELILQRPEDDQYKLYLECIPGTERYTEDFARLMSFESIASTGLGASRILGDPKGPYIGTTGPLSKKVFLDMSRAPLENKSASATFYGNLGVGKSFNANLLLILQVIYGGYALIFDPKEERSHWEEKLPWLKGLISIIRLSSDEKYKGMLDPFNVYRNDIEAACDLAQNIIAELNRLTPKNEEYTVLKESLVKIKEVKNPSMLKLIEILESYPESDEYALYAKKLARNLKTFEGIGMSKLLLGDGTEESINFTNRINILQIANLKLPDADIPKDDYTDEEVLSNVILTVMSNFAKTFAMTLKNKFKVILFDESWFLKNSAAGRKLYAFLTRMARSLFCGCIFNGHSVLDIPSEEVKNTISYKFCFQTDEEAEAERMCKYLKIQSSKENINRIMTLENGQCMFKDLDGRIGRLTFDAVLDEIIECFRTTPKKNGDDNEEVAS